MSEQPEPTVAAILTPPGRGAVATVAVDGPQAISIVKRLFAPATSRPFIDRPPGDIVYGRWSSSNEDLVVFRCNDNRVEVHCHGGATASRAVLDSLSASGCAAVSWQEFVRRDEPDRIRAAARVALAECRTERTASILLHQYQGALAEALRGVASTIEHRQAEAAMQSLELLLSRSQLGLHLASPWHVVIAGPPNVGKSSLINALLGYERAIVFDQPGTTRDVVTALTAFDGWPVELSDTAGLRDSNDELELAGVTKAQQQLASADLIILVFDRSQAWSHDEQLLVDQWPAALTIHNKLDLTSDLRQSDSNVRQPIGIEVSALNGQGLPDLIHAITKRLVPSPPAPSEAVPFTAEQVAAIEDTLQTLRVGRVAEARNTLAAICDP